MAIYGSLRERIVRYELRPGERISENQIAAAYGASRTPVRESLRRLEQIGLITREGGSGYLIRPFNLDEMDELYEVRLALEEVSVRSVAARLTPELAERLWEEWRRFPSDGDPSEALAEDERFHEVLAEEGQNQTLLQFLRTVNERIHILRRIDFTSRDRWVATRAEHREILEALTAGSANDAAALMRAHIQRSKEICARLAAEGLALIYRPTREGEQNG
jgi:DNA-binding GntR family transcriptional regulator